MPKKKTKKLYRAVEPDAKLFGVCAGIADYFDVDPTVVRIAWIIFSLVYGAGLLAYVICAFCMPTKS